MKLALCHMKVQHKAQDRNLDELVSCVQNAASKGAQLVVAPELCLTGYSFESTDDIRRFADTAPGKATEAVAEVANNFGCYVVFGMAERCADKDNVYNSAIAINGDGQIVAKHRKITAEVKWATDGDDLCESIFETPFGKMGLLVCSDSYYGLLPKLYARNGVDLLIIPANWPPIGLNPLEIWSLRALENGLYIAACNRTGRDKTMDCTPAESAVLAPDGSIIAKHQSAQSTVVFCDLDFEATGMKSVMRSTDRFHIQELVRRFPDAINTSARSLEITVIGKGTSKSRLPPLKKGDSGISSCSDQPPRMIICPIDDDRDQHRAELRRIVQKENLMCCCHDAGQMVSIITPDAEYKTPESLEEKAYPLIVRHQGVTIALVSKAQLLDTEVVFLLSTAGCDMVLMVTGESTKEERALFAVRSVEQLAVLVISHDVAYLSLPPQGHSRWVEKQHCGKGPVTWTVDLSQTKKKSFLRRIDYLKLAGEKANG